jgi:hypothetical protein
MFSRLLNKIKASFSAKTKDALQNELVLDDEAALSYRIAAQMIAEFERAKWEGPIELSLEIVQQEGKIASAEWMVADVANGIKRPTHPEHMTRQ